MQRLQREHLDVEEGSEDPWGTDLFYNCEDGRKYSLKSFGADKKEGGEGNDKDISTEDPDF